MKPISPEEVVKKKKDSLPEEVIDATNELIAENWDGVSSKFKQCDLVKRIVAKWKGEYES